MINAYDEDKVTNTKKMTHPTMHTAVSHVYKDDIIDFEEEDKQDNDDDTVDEED